MKLLIGKYINLDTSDTDVPLSYLIWLESQPWIGKDLRDDLNEEIEKRTGNRPGAGKVVKK